MRAILVCVGLGAGYAIALLIDTKHYWISAAVFLLLLTVTLLEFVFADYVADSRYPYETEKKLALLEERLGSRGVEALREKLARTIAGFEACETKSISGTVHIIVELNASPESSARQGLMQLTDYVGSRGGSKGRITALEKGIIGRCARTGNSESVNFVDEREYVSRMVREFGFSADETERHTKSARSYLAHPVKSLAGSTLGVVYFFSTEPQVFPAAARRMDLDAIASDIRGLLQAISIV